MKFTDGRFPFDFTVQVNSSGFSCPYPSLGMLMGVLLKQAALMGREIPVPPELPDRYRTFDRVDIVISSFEGVTIPADHGAVRMVVADCRFVEGGSVIARVDVYAAYDSDSGRVMIETGPDLFLMTKLARHWEPSLEWYNPVDDLDVN